MKEITPSVHSKGKDLGTVVRKSFFKTALIPILIVELVLLGLYFLSTHYVVKKNLELLNTNALETILEISSIEAQGFDDKLKEISRHNLSLQAEHQKMFSRSSQEGSFEQKLFAEKVGYDLSRDLNPSGNSSLYLSTNTPLIARIREKMKRTEEMDIRFKSLVDNNANLETAYFISWDNMVRIYPEKKDFHTQFPKDFDLTQYNFYYLANKIHNAERKSIWTDVHLDPAGKGWMLSNLVPVYQNSFLEGVTGLDLTLSTFSKHLSSNNLQWDAGTLVMDREGNMLTMSRSAENYLGLTEGFHDSSDNKVPEQAVTMKKELNLVKQDSDVGKHFSDFFNGSDKTSEFTINGEQYLVTKHEVSETGWQLFVMAPLNNVYGPIIAEKERIIQYGLIFLGFAAVFHALFFVYLSRSSKALAKRITSPIKQITDLIVSYDSVDKAPPVHQPVNITELDKLLSMNLKIQKAKTRYQKISQEMKVKNEQLKTLSITDQLTQLYNRLKLDEVLNYEIARSKRDETPLTVAIIDIDHFKSVNDTYGHQIGDTVLIGVSQIMLKNTRSTDILGRWGGEEFMLILPNTSPENAYEYADQLRQAIAAADFNPVKQITISIGLASCTQFNCASALVELADNALYEAKENGRNRVEEAGNSQALKENAARDNVIAS